jgi:hypothetical protein
MKKKKTSSGGHKLGQLVGDWYERHIAAVVFESVANDLGLYLDHRFKERSCRGGKILWDDLEGNSVDYDFVLELGGTDSTRGVPIAFFETFWRRGARHSKDKARDDSGKLLPMRDTYPTARVLGIVSAGDFTKPAQEYVQSRGIDLFFIPKNNIVKAWNQSGIEIDYLDGAKEEEKARLVDSAQLKLEKESKEKEIATNLYEICGNAVFESYIERLKALVSSVPVSYGLTSVYLGEKIQFSDHIQARNYLDDFDVVQKINSSELKHKIIYEAVYSDGAMFERESLDIQEALKLHNEVGRVAEYFKKILNNK